MKSKLKHSQRLSISFYFIAFLLVLELINIVTNRSLNVLAIVPRETAYLHGVLTSAFVHKDLHHFISNAFTLFVFCYLLLGYGTRRFMWVSAVSIVVTGLLVWIFARNGAHLGASGLIYALFGYLLLTGFKSKQVLQIVISCALAFFYGGLILGVLPSTGFVSWESHLAGFVIGLYMAWKLPASNLH